MTLINSGFELLISSDLYGIVELQSRENRAHELKEDEESVSRLDFDPIVLGFGDQLVNDLGMLAGVDTCLAYCELSLRVPR